MIVVPVKASTRIYPQMSQMFTDEENIRFLVPTLQRL